MANPFEHLCSVLYNRLWFEKQTWRLGIVIPAFAEPDLWHVLDSLSECEGILDHDVAVLLVINHGEQAEEEQRQLNEAGFSSLKREIERVEFPLAVHYYRNLPNKIAGVGLARKLGMDFVSEHLISRGEKKGLIINLDADCSVASSYISVLRDWQQTQIKTEAASLYFEHPFPDESELRSAIILYELHLRYYIEAQRILGLPYAFHTIGSAMAVRAERYVKSGGMNTRKAGEDFYFLQKLIQAAPFSEIVNTTVFPSARISSRVPFGTGRAMSEYLEKKRYSTTYSLQCFEKLETWLSAVAMASKISASSGITVEDAILNDFLEEFNFQAKWQEICANSKPGSQRWRRFLQWFDAFMLMKWCHYYRSRTGDEMATTEASRKLIAKVMPFQNLPADPEALLSVYRLIQRNHSYTN